MRYKEGGPFKFDKGMLNYSPYNIRGCFICGGIPALHGVHGENRNTSAWLRDAADDSIVVCNKEECFNICLLRQDELLRIPF